MALRLIGFVIVVLALWFFTTQIVIPLIRARPLFPLFRSEDRALTALKEEVASLQQQVDVLEDAYELTEAVKKLARAKAKLEAVTATKTKQ